MLNGLESEVLGTAPSYGAIRRGRMVPSVSAAVSICIVARLLVIVIDIRMLLCTVRGVRYKIVSSIGKSSLVNKT